MAKRCVEGRDADDGGDVTDRAGHVEHLVRGEVSVLGDVQDGVAELLGRSAACAADSVTGEEGAPVGTGLPHAPEPIGAHTGNAEFGVSTHEDGASAARAVEEYGYALTVVHDEPLLSLPHPRLGARRGVHVPEL